MHCTCVRERSAAKGAHVVRARASSSARRKQSAGRRGTVVVALCNRFVSSSLFVFYPSLLSFDCYKPYIPSRLPDFWQVPYSFTPEKSFRSNLFSISTMDYHYDVMNCRTPKEQFAEGVSVPVKFIYSRCFHHPDRRWRPRCTSDNNCTTDIIWLATNRGGRIIIISPPWSLCYDNSIKKLYSQWLDVFYLLIY